ncbi:serine hydrolase domain-containing protein [Leptospira ognonensis]|uniref:serine hydrolase domain-containing protein n=1 Tax=Leptospira ognonensis TaxID=2484945 RepID=UPI001438403A|nr:serine hydrolase domain-containing protein [Leptospira ognonensis]
MVEINGSCHKKFLPVKDAFAENFASGDEIGAAVSIFHKGVKVVDLWAGYKNVLAKEVWDSDTSVPFFSVTKGITSLCFLMLAERKKIKYDNPVSTYWPEFGKNGKESITVKQLLEHTAGLHALKKSLSINDFWNNPTKVYGALIDQKPAWAPGTKQAYGAQIWGAYAAELFKQIAGESAGKFFQREVAKKLKLNLFLGLPNGLESKVATIYPVSNIRRIMLLLPQILRGEGSEGRAGRAVLFGLGNSEVNKAYLNPSMGTRGLNAFNDPLLHKQELLWANGIGDARSLATLFNVLAHGGKKGKLKLVGNSMLKIVTAKRDLLYDEVIHKRMAWSLGFLKEEDGLFSPNFETFGHPGMGGCLAFADTRAKISFGYVCNKMDYRVRPPKTLRLAHSVYKCL